MYARKLNDSHHHPGKQQFVDEICLSAEKPLQAEDQQHRNRRQQGIEIAAWHPPIPEPKGMSKVTAHR
jgi:hypothetical protein